MFLHYTDEGESNSAQRDIDPRIQYARVNRFLFRSSLPLSRSLHRDSY